MSQDCPQDEKRYSTIPTTGVFPEGVWPSAVMTGQAGGNDSVIPVLTQGFQGKLSSAGWTKGNEGYKQQTFLGASISNFSLSAGFGDTSSSLQVTLVNDEYNTSDGTHLGSGDDVYHNGQYDQFKPPVVGSPVFFKFGKQRATVPQAWLKTYFEKYNGYFVPEYIYPTGKLEDQQLAQNAARLPDGRYIDLEKSKNIRYQDLKRADLTGTEWHYEDQLPPKAIRDANYYPWADLASQVGRSIYDFVGWNHFVFGGILSSYSQKKGSSNTFDVTVSDPREILSNVVLVLNDYQGTTFDNKNMYNIYGFLEYDLADDFQEFVDDYNIGKSVLTKNDDGFFNGNDLYRFPKRLFQEENFNFSDAFAWSNLSDEDIVKLSGPEFFPITGQGFSRRSERGIPLYRVTQALNALFGYDGQLWGEYERAGFGGPIDFRGYNYVVDFGGIPFNKVPPMYFVEQNQMDLLSFVQEITEIIGHDFSVSLLPVIDAKPTASLYSQNLRAMKEGRFGDIVTGIIRIDTVDRSVQPRYGAVKEYIDLISQPRDESFPESDKVFVESQNIGYDLSNVTTDKFVVGGQEVNMYTFARNKDNLYRQYLKKQSPRSQEDSYDFLRQEEQWRLDTMYKQQVVPFYGFLDKETPTIPIGFGPFQQILLDSSNVDAINVGNYYITTEMELRAASISYSAWQKFLMYYNERYGELTETPIKVPEDTADRKEIEEIRAAFANVITNLQTKIPSSESIPFEVTDKEYIIDNFNFDKEEIMGSNNPVLDSEVFARVIDNPDPESEEKRMKFWRVDSMSVPRCVFNSSREAVDEDGLPVDVCQPPYGYPLYYKRAERIGVGGGGYVDILQDIKNVQTAQERLIKEMIENDPEFAHYAEFRDTNKILKVGQATIRNDDIGEKLRGSQYQFIEPNFRKYSEEKLNELKISIWGSLEDVPSDAAKETPDKFERYKELAAPIIRSYRIQKKFPDAYAKKYRRNYMGVKNQSSQNGQLAASATAGININLENSKKVYDWIKGVADKHLGKTYLVKMPKNANVNYKYKMGPKGIINGQGAWVDSGPFGFPPLKNIGDLNQPYPKQFDPSKKNGKESSLNKEKFHHYLQLPSGLEKPLKWTEGALRTSYNPIDGDWEHNYKPEPQGGYFDWTMWSSGLDQTNRIFPQVPDQLTEGYRIKPYVRFDHSQFYDFGSVGSIVTEEIPSTARTEDFISDMYNGFAASEFVRRPGDQTDKVLFKKKDNYSYVEVNVDEKLYLAPKLETATVKVYGQRYTWNNTELIESKTLDENNKVVPGVSYPPIIYRPGNQLFWKQETLVSGELADNVTNTYKWLYNVPKTVTASGFYYVYTSGTKEEIDQLKPTLGEENWKPVKDYGDPTTSSFARNITEVSDNAIFVKNIQINNWNPDIIRDLAGGVDLKVEEGDLKEGDSEDEGSIGISEYYTGYNLCEYIEEVSGSLDIGDFYTDADGNPNNTAVREVYNEMLEFCAPPPASYTDDERYEGAFTKIVDFKRSPNILGENKVSTSRQDLNSDAVYALVTLPGRVNALVDGFFADGLKNNSSPIQFANMFSADVVFKDDFTNQSNDTPNYALPTTAKISGVVQQAVADGTIDAEDPLATVNNLAAVVNFFQKKGVQYPFGSPDTKAMFTSPSPIMPHLFVLPLMSKERCYGPWLSAVSGSPADGGKFTFRDIGGKVEYVKDESLTPWNFGGYGAMNEVGLLKSQFSNSLQLFTEKGSFTVADAPTGILVGSPFIGGGPLVTSVSVNVSEGGIKSTINMNLYGTQFGKLTKQKEDQLAKLNRERQKQLDQTNELKRKGIYKSRTNNLGVDSDLASKVDALTRQYKQNSFKAGNTTQNTIVFNGTATEESVSFLGSGGLRTAEQLQYGSFVSLQEDGFKQQVETEVDSYVGISILRQQAAESDLNSMFTGYDQSVYNPYMPTKDFIQRDAINRRMRF